MSRPSCSGMNESIQLLIGHIYVTGEHHNESSNARQESDRKDTEAITEYLCDRNLFGIEVLKRISSYVL